jgi:nucleoside 2-deoxyribosyltransferase
MTKVYICGRVAHEARAFNLEVTIPLRDAGFTCYLPQEMAPNNLSDEEIAEGRYDVKTIFLMDYEALSNADVVVAVGRIGSDCSWELGYAWARGIPVVHVPGTDDTWKRSPMLIPTLSQYHKATPKNVAARVAVAVCYGVPE